MPRRPIEAAAGLHWSVPYEALPVRQADERPPDATGLGLPCSWVYDPALDTMTWSEAASRMFGLPRRADITAQVCAARLGAAGWSRLRHGLDAATGSAQSLDETLRFTTVDGEAGWLRFTAAADGARILHGTVRDVTHDRAVPARPVSAQDGMTGLPNRPLFQEQLGALLRPDGLGPPCALFRLVVDGLKTINELHGSDVGDSVLRDVAAAVSAACRDGDLAARIGSAEFAVLAFGIGTQDEARQRADALRARLAPLAADRRALPPVTASIGVSLYPAHAASRDDLMSFADLALGQARHAGCDQTTIFRRDFAETLKTKHRQRAELRHGLLANELEIFYQPIVDLRTSIVRGWEALVRWRHPVRGLLTPGAFLIGLADEALAMDIDRFVLRSGLFQMRAWLDAGVPVTCVGVNTSAHQLRRADFVDEIAKLLDESGLTPDRLKLEVLETAFFGDRVDQVADTILRLSRIGVVCALDDFGTGYASLTHLKTFKVERLKIDMSFVKNILSDPFDKAITRSVIDLGRNLGMRVTAEGIETKEQLRLLQDFGCDCGQGYLFGRPMPAHEVPHALTAWHGGRSACILDRVSNGQELHDPPAQ